VGDWGDDEVAGILEADETPVEQQLLAGWGPWAGEAHCVTGSGRPSGGQFRLFCSDCLGPPLGNLMYHGGTQGAKTESWVMPARTVPRVSCPLPASFCA
jgi:hypothetical protein